jgi:Zn finger protein HypA/HybF involved in hydrogenase expression
MRGWLFAVAVLIGGIAAVLTYAEAQTPSSSAPGAGHGFLIDKHIAAGLNCAACHAESPPSKPADTAVCVKCHGTNAQVAAKTASDQPNPHASHLGEIACTSCHHVHQASVLYCAQCHNFDLKTP